MICNMTHVKFTYRRIRRKIHDCAVMFFRRRCILRECCENTGMMYAMLGVVPRAFRITALNFMNNFGEPMSLFGPIFESNIDTGDGSEFMKNMRNLRHFPYMEICAVAADGTNGKPKRYDYILYANEIARLNIMYRRSRAGHRVNVRTLPMINPVPDGNYVSFTSGKVTYADLFPRSLCEFNLTDIIRRNLTSVKNPFEYIPRLNSHKKSDNGSIQYTVTVGKTDLPFAYVRNNEFTSNVWSADSYSMEFYEEAFDFCMNVRRCSLFDSRDFNGKRRIANRRLRLQVQQWSRTQRLL